MRERADWRPAGVATAIAVASGVLGLGWGDALLVGLVTYVIGLVMVSTDAEQATQWPVHRLDETPGTRREVSALTWSFLGLDGRVSEVAVRRLRQEATRRLARRGVVIPRGLGATTRTSPEVSDELREQIREQLGDRTWTILTAPGGWMPSLREIAHCVEAIERLGTRNPVRTALRGQA